MKKILILILLFLSIFIVGCVKDYNKSVVKNIKRRLKLIGNFSFTKAQSTIICEPLDEETDFEKAVEAVSKVFGIADNKSVVKNIKKILDKGNGYYLAGELSIFNNDDNYNYKVDVYYKKDDYYKVILTNKFNDHTQIILKNDDGVYVLTPALNKSFKFQSDWPNDNSQIYLLDALLRDI